MVRATLSSVQRKLTTTTDRTSLTSLVAELDRAWTSPCLAHVARFSPRPFVASVAELQALWSSGLREIAGEVGGFYVRDGERFWIVPPTARAPLDVIDPSLASLICPKEEAQCGNASLYVARTEAAFDAEADRIALARADRFSRGSPCEDLATRPHPGPETLFEAWASCALRTVAVTYRYPPLRFRAPERGWLVLRGRRGHYDFSDVLFAFDLATGAAYVASSRSKLVLADAEVDHDAVDRQRRSEAYTGNVPADVVRELTFVLLSRKALAPARRTSSRMVVPTRIDLALSPTFELDRGKEGWGSSNQTSIAYTLIDDGRILDEGEVTWPDSSDPAEARADGLLRLVEAGIDRGCARAKLPKCVRRPIVIAEIGAS